MYHEIRYALFIPQLGKLLPLFLRTLEKVKLGAFTEFMVKRFPRLQ